MINFFWNFQAGNVVIDLLQAAKTIYLLSQIAMVPEKIILFQFD